jgi:carboxymethylenebutenolidase
VTAVDASWITFVSGGDRVRGYLAVPRGSGPLGGVVCAPENLGLTEHRQEETRRLAAEGFAVLTVDPYSRIGGKPPQDYRDAEERRSKAFIAARDEIVVPDCQAALDWLAGQDRADRSRIAALGYCLGGGTALAWAAQTADLACAIILYALPVIPGRYVQSGKDLSRLALASAIKCPLQLHFGDADEAIPLEHTLKLKAALERESAHPVEFNIYAGARHAYMDSTLDRYSPEASALTFERIVGYLHNHIDVDAAHG